MLRFEIWYDMCRSDTCVSQQAVNLLSEEEIKLCSTLRLLPQQYLIIKNLLVTESARAGFLDRTTATQILQVDVHKVGSIYDFFVQHDWVQPKA